MEHCIEIKNLSKIYRRGKSKFAALSDVNLDIGTGMFGLLGPNGAGKSTAMSILATLAKPTTGDIKIYGYDLQKNRKEIRMLLGFLPQEFGVYPNLDAEEFLDYIGQLKGLKERKNRKKEIDYILELTNLSHLRDRRIKTFSGGMIRRLGIAQALLGSPKLLIVDEPTTGLDPEERIRFRNLLAEISSDVTIILSTHIVNDISSTCNSLAVLNLGKIVYHGHPADIIKNAVGKTFLLRTNEKELATLKENVSVISMIMQPDHIQARVVADDVNGLHAEPVDPNLEDAYIYFMEVQTGVKLHEDEALYQSKN